MSNNELKEMLEEILYRIHDNLNKRLRVIDRDRDKLTSEGITEKHSKMYTNTQEKKQELKLLSNVDGWIEYIKKGPSNE